VETCSRCWRWPQFLPCFQCVGSVRCGKERPRHCTGLKCTTNVGLGTFHIPTDDLKRKRRYSKCIFELHECVVNFVPKNAPHSVFVHCQCSTPSSVLCIRDVLGQVRTNHRYTGYTSLPYAPNEANYLQSRKTTFTKYNRATHKNTSQDTTYCINTDVEPSNAALSPASEFPPAIKFVKAKFACPPLIVFLSICLMCGVNLHWKTPKLPLIKTLQVRKKWRNVSLKGLVQDDTISTGPEMQFYLRDMCGQPQLLSEWCSFRVEKDPHSL
jgi:hypothetical protein